MIDNKDVICMNSSEDFPSLVFYEQYSILKLDKHTYAWSYECVIDKRRCPDR